MHQDTKEDSIVRSLSSTRFVISALVLIVSAIGLRPGMQALGKHYQKQSIAIRKPLKQFDASRLPSFRTGWRYRWLPVPVKDLGTDEYAYIGLTRKRYSAGPQYADIVVSYYNDPRDKVPHTPDVCYRQAGAVVEKTAAIMLQMPELAPEHPEIPAQLLIFNWGTYKEIVIYFFYAEGKFKRTREQVRWVLAKPGNRYTYFAKIETGVHYPLGSDPAEPIEMCKQLARQVVPPLLADHFPKTAELKGR